MILDIYFKRPIFWDYILSVCITSALIFCFLRDKITLPDDNDSYSLTGDLTNIALTMGGFILTILTVLITFKDNSSANVNADGAPTFNRFFSTDYYHETVRHLKNCIKSIIVIAALGFFFKLALIQDVREYLFFLNVFGITIIIFSVYRCLLILSRILELQKSD